MIQIKDLKAFYGPIEALKGIDLEVKAGSITALIGSNGAGKTTTLNAISGTLNRTGSICYKGIETISYSPQKLAKLGVVHVPEGRHIFAGLSVEDNLITGTVNWRGLLGRGDYSKELEEVYALFPRLRERRTQLGWSLSGGEQQMLAIGRGLMGHPEVLMLDEPSMGLAPMVVKELFEKIVQINKLGITIVLVEQNATLALKISSYAYVLEQGKIALSGPSDQLFANPKVKEAYLGA